ncbi:MFS transporter [Nocardia sp. NPDC046473]|uniref:MFS transporter n=1 Tax=Nocardia sp. NPDC046473 TaxID=3155733 RepID=UPI0033DDCAA3
MSGRRSQAIFGNRDFVLLWFGNATSLIGLFGARITYPLLVLASTGSPALAGWVGFAISLPSLLFQIPAGIVADYADRRRTLIGCQLAGLAAAGAAVLVVGCGLPNPALLLAITAFVEGTAYVFFSLSELGAVRDVVTVEQRPGAFSLFEAEQPIATVVGRATGAAMFGALRWLPFVADAASYAVSLATLSVIRGDFSARDRHGASSRRGLLLDGVRAVWTEPFLRVSTLISGLSNMVIQIVILLLILRLGSTGRPTWTVGVVLGAAGVGGVLGSFVAARLTARYSARTVYRGSLFGWTVLLVPIVLSTNPVVLVACWCGVGAVGTVVNVALTLFRVRVIPEQTLGRAVGAANLVTDGAVALGALLAGYLLSAFGTTATGSALVCAMLVLAIGAHYLGGPTQRAGESIPEASTADSPHRG